MPKAPKLLNPKVQPMLDLIIKNGILLSMAGGKAGIIPHGAIGIRDDQIICVDESLTLEKLYTAKRVIDAEGKFILPGFVNAHTHSSLGIGKGILTGLRYYLEQGLAGYIEPGNIETTMAGARMHILEGLKQGFTTFCDNNSNMDKIAAIYEEFGARARISEMVREMPWDYRGKLEEIYSFDRKYAEPQLKATYRLLDRYGTDPADRISVMVSFQGLDYNSEELVLEIKELAARHKTMIHTHLAQSPFEVRQCEMRYGKRPVAVMDQLGLLNQNTLAAHMVYNTSEENKLAARNGLRMCYCPNSFTLAGGIPPAAEYLHFGGTVGIGSDECTYNCVNPFVEMRSALIRGNIGARLASVPPIKLFSIFRMATIESAKVIGMDQHIGSLEPGKKADVVIFDQHTVNMVPILVSPMSNVIQNMIIAATGSEVETVVIGGRIIMEKRKMLAIDEPAVIGDAQKFGQLAAEAAYEYYKNLPDSEVLKLQQDYYPD